MSSSPLPRLSGFEDSIGSDWQTGDVGPDPVFQRGKWWANDRWDYHSQGRDREYDRRRLRLNRAVRTYLSTQSASTGL